MLTLRAAFPDISFHMVGQPRGKDDAVVYEWVATGTHSGPAFADFMIGPFPEASGKRIEPTRFSIARLADGKIVEESIWSKEHQAEIERTVGRWLL